MTLRAPISNAILRMQGKRRFGYSRDKRSDCVQVVIALIVTPDGFPLAYEVMSGNTSDKTTLADFLKSIEDQYGKANRVWVMDRGIPTEETLRTMRQTDPPIHYLVGTPKGRLTKLEKDFLDKPWQKVRDVVGVKLLEKDDELYVMARSEGRVSKERAMRRRRLKKLWNRLKQLQNQNITRDTLLMKVGAAKKDAGRSYFLVDIKLPGTKRTGQFGNLHFPVTQKQTADCKTQRRMLSASFQPGSPEPCNTMGVLHPTHGSRASLQGFEAGSGRKAGLPPGR